MAIFVIALLLFARAAGIDTAILKGQSPEKDSKQQEAEAQKAAIRAEAEKQRAAIRVEAEAQRAAVSAEAGTQATSAPAVAAPATAKAGAETMVGTLASIAGASGVGLRMLFKAENFSGFGTTSAASCLRPEQENFFSGSFPCLGSES